MTCQCVSIDCGSFRHAGLNCEVEAKHKVMSRDFGGEVLEMCTWCAIYARASGMFVRVAE